MTEVNDKGIGADLIRDLHDEDKKVVASQTAGNVPLGAKKTTVADTVESVHNGGKREGIARAIKAAPLGERKATVREAVNSASPENKQAVAKEAVESLPHPERQELVRQLGPPSPVVTDLVWLTVVATFKWVLWGSALALVAAIGVALFREVDAAYVQILLTVFTTVAGIFAGFISGKALGDANGR